MFIKISGNVEKNKMNPLHEIFNNEPVSEEIIQFMKNQILKDKAERHKIKLISHGEILYVSNPFKQFYGDCTYCSKYYSDELYCGFITGGTCTLHKVGCGPGFTCKNNDFKDVF